MPNSTVVSCCGTCETCTLARSVGFKFQCRNVAVLVPPCRRERRTSDSGVQCSLTECVCVLCGPPLQWKARLAESAPDIPLAAVQDEEKFFYDAIEVRPGRASGGVPSSSSLIPDSCFKFILLSGLRGVVVSLSLLRLLFLTGTQTCFRLVFSFRVLP